MNIFVAKLNFSTDNDELREAFEAFGAVDSAKVIMDHETGKSRGFGFVEMPDDEEALAAIEALNGAQIAGREVVVKKAEPRKKQNNFRSSYDRRGGSGDRGGYRGGGGGRGGYRENNDRGGDRGGYRDGGDRNDRRGFRDNNDRYDRY